MKKNPSEETEPHAEAVRRLLLAAYDAWKRDLPWRGESDPYRIWVSEVMLQQTRVETVIPYYEEWLKRFPDLDSLAEAEADDVLRVWQGLGYYSRARRLHEGARVVREEYAGRLPRNTEQLRGLPGIGEYTAGAVASIAFGDPVPAVDGNVKRVLSRLYDLPSPIPSRFRDLAASLVDPDRPGDFNQALMELGASVCTPRSPRCGECPISSECLAMARGTVGKRPATRSKKPIPELEVVVLVAVARDKEERPCFLLRKRPPTGLLAGMWGFPEMEVAKDGFAPGSEYESERRICHDRDAAVVLAKGLGLRLPALEVAGDPGPGRFPATPGTAAQTDIPVLETVTHVFSHLRVRYRPFLAFSSHPPASDADKDGFRWILAENLGDVPLPVAQRKIAEDALKSLAG